MLAIPVLPWLPGLLVALFAFYCGTFSGVGFVATLLGSACLLLFSYFGWPHWRRPFGPGPALSLLPWALLVVVLASWRASPVVRAGTTAVALLPIYLVLPAAFARCWATEQARRVGLRVLMGTIASVAAASLFGFLMLGDPRPSWPLGHHNLLAGWLLLLSPLLFALRRDSRFWRYAAGFTVLLALVALLLSRSLSGLLGLAAMAILLALQAKRRWLGMLFVVLVAATALPRLAAVVEGRDSSFDARLVYLEGAWKGLVARPGLGWGPGSSAWTLPLHLEPKPGVNPAGEIVTHAHDLPLRLAYELGIGGALIALGLGVALWRQAGNLGASTQAGELARGAQVAVTGFVVWSLGGAVLEVQALPVALALVIGASIAASGREQAPKAGPWWMAIVLGAALLPGLAGLAEWDRAVGDEANPRHVEKALARDAAFPLYLSRSRFEGLDPEAAAGELLRAARMAPGSSVLWIRAGEAAREADLPWAPEALARACKLDPLGPFAPFLLFLADVDHPEAADSAARALLAEPRLAAATAWQGREPLLEAAIARLEAWPGVDEGWRATVAETVRSMPSPSASLAHLRLNEDVRPPTSTSLFVFRRRPWPAEVVSVEVDLARAGHLDLVPAFALSTTASEALSRGCR